MDWGPIKKKKKKKKKRVRGGGRQLQTKNNSREPQSCTISYAPSKIANGVRDIPFLQNFICEEDVKLILSAKCSRKNVS